MEYDGIIVQLNKIFVPRHYTHESRDCLQVYDTELFGWDCRSRHTKEKYCCIYLHKFPTCCGIVILSRLWVEPIKRRKGVGTLLIQLAETRAKYTHGYSAICCTYTAEENIRFGKLIKKLGWKDVFSFYNSSTGNTVVTAVKDLT